MHYDYVVALKRENARRTDLVSILLLVSTLLIFCYIEIRSGFRIFLSFAAVVIITGICINLFAYSRGRIMRFRNWLFATGLFWIGAPALQWMCIPFVFFAFMETQAKYPLEIAFFKGGVVLNSLLKKKYPWTSLQSVILKDGILTLDFKNNRLIQKEVIDDNEPDADENEFNEYCRGKLLNL